MDRIELKAMAKINLGLDVVRRRPDGYHEVKMVMQMLHLHDEVVVAKRAEPGIHLTTNLDFLPVDDGNIAYRAAKVLMDAHGINEGVEIRIEKTIPVAAGMAGGSTNCAAVLHGVNQIFELGLTLDELMAVGVKLGADVPYCLMQHTALSEGIGEILTPVPSLPACKVLIAKPEVGVSTKEVYQNLKLDTLEKHPDIDGIVTALKDGDLYGVTDRLENVLETVTVKMHPVINEIKQLMLAEGAVNALMSGSGPTVFGIFDDDAKAEKAYNAMKASGLAKDVHLTTPYRE